MKVLFAVSSESISEAIVKKYQKEYKEILSYKNVYYFNAILKEIQKDKSYDRIIISEDLESFSNNNYEAIDKFIFEKLDDISDEAQDIDGNETSIILICGDRHTKGSSFLVKIFGIGIYNALLGTERSIDNVCKLINKTRVKKEAKIYYKIDADDVNYNNRSDNEVSELEIQNILTHFRKLGRNTDKYAESFNSIATQYTDDQLKIVINCLPINVKAVLEEECQKYQELMSVNGVVQRVNSQEQKAKEARKQTGIKIDIIENKMNQNKISGPILITSSVKTSGKTKNKTVSQVTKPVVKNVVEEKKAEPTVTKRKVVKRENKIEDEVKVEAKPIQENKPIENIEQESVKKPAQQFVFKKKRLPDGRIVKVKVLVPIEEKNETKKDIVAAENKTKEVINKNSDIAQNTMDSSDNEIKPAKKRGRPRKNPIANEASELEDDDLILPGMNEDFEDESDSLPGLNNNFEDEEDSLPGLDEDFEEDDSLLGMDEEFEEVDDLLQEDEELEEDNSLLGIDEEEYTDEVALPGLDELDDIDNDTISANDKIDDMLPDVDDSDDLLSGLYDDDIEFNNV